ncbi:MAG: methionyl-tRNA formyltransferase [bacterium]
MKIIFMGTPKFARQSLVCLNGSRHDVVAVVTGPDQRSRRGGQMIPTPVGREAQELGLEIYKPASLKEEEFCTKLSNYAADLIVVVAFKILPEKLFSLPARGSINIHTSLLPRYRGAAPINWALINGEKETGLSSFFLKRKVDTGDIILQEKVTITENDTFDTLSARLSELAGPFLLRTLDLVENPGPRRPRSQEDDQATPAPRIQPFDAMIDFGMPASRVCNFVRGLSSTPGAYTFFRGNRIKILACRQHSGATPIPGERHLRPGTILDDRRRFLVQCADLCVEVVSVLPQGKKLISGRDFLNGITPLPGECLGEIPREEQNQQ